LSTVTALGSPVFVRDQGSGPPVLFLHGNPDTADLWDPIVAELQTRFRCLAPDLPGFGGSAVPPGFDFGLPAMSRWVDGVLTALQVEEPVALVVHDFGGPYGFSWAVEHPAKVGRMVAINTFFTSELRWHFWARVWRTPWLGELSMAIMNRWLFAFELRRGGPRLSPEHIQQAFSHVTPATKRTVLRLYRATDPQCLRGWDERFRALAAEKPVKVLWGRGDPYLPIEMARSFGTADIEILDGVGHWLPAEAPALVVERLRSFLVQTPA
jgi:pimeloyl-ACP methyl ester carboxylesterase